MSTRRQIKTFSKSIDRINQIKFTKPAPETYGLQTLQGHFWVTHFLNTFFEFVDTTGFSGKK